MRSLDHPRRLWIVEQKAPKEGVPPENEAMMYVGQLRGLQKL